MQAAHSPRRHVEARVQDISIWCLDLRRIALAAMRALLSADEQARGDRLRMRADHERFVKSRGALRCILAGRTAQDARELVFIEGHGRKPVLRDHPSVHFNLSHSGDFVLIAAGAEPLGVDIEAMRDLDARALAAMNFHPDEIAAMEAQTDPRAAFFQLWAHKEAFLKATGIGLTDQLTSISIPLGGGRVEAPASLSSDPWCATPLDTPAAYKASVVTRGARPTPHDLTASFVGQGRD
jgi:4'-phosphopantetheinyl transferase